MVVSGGAGLDDRGIAMSTRIDDDNLPYVAPDRYGVRVVHQSGAEQLAAAEFLLATRQQEDSRRRMRDMVSRLRLRAGTATKG